MYGQTQTQGPTAGPLIPTALHFWDNLLFGAGGVDPGTLALIGVIFGMLLQGRIGGRRRKGGIRRGIKRRGRQTTKPKKQYTSEREELIDIIKGGAKVRARR